MRNPKAEILCRNFLRCGFMLMITHIKIILSSLWLCKVLSVPPWTLSIGSFLLELFSCVSLHCPALPIETGLFLFLHCMLTTLIHYRHICILSCIYFIYSFRTKDPFEREELKQHSLISAVTIEFLLSVSFLFHQKGDWNKINSLSEPEIFHLKRTNLNTYTKISSNLLK